MKNPDMCFNCKFWDGAEYRDGGDGELGHCRRYPPAPKMQNMIFDIQKSDGTSLLKEGVWRVAEFDSTSLKLREYQGPKGRYPETFATQWCGEYQSGQNTKPLHFGDYE